MKALIVFALICGIKAKDLPDANAFLEFHRHNLTQTYQNVLQGSMNGDFVRFRGYNLIDYGVYKTMPESRILAIKKPLIFFRGIIVSNPLYSEYGGATIQAVFIRESKEQKAKKVSLNFAGRYLSDLLTIGEGSEFYALCALPYVNRCVLLGIGERW